MGRVDMVEVLVFGGTTEGRLLVEWLDARGTCDIVVCTATAYGAVLVAGGRRVHTLTGPLSADDKHRLLEAHDFACIVDATHPYAQHISESVADLARERSLELVRIVREEGADTAADQDATSDTAPWISVASPAAAARHLAATTGNILLTTGSNDLDTFVRAIPDFTERLYVRILPVERSLARTVAAGIPPRHVVAMQGPFSTQLNVALIRELAIEHLVTKRSGRAGGFDEKLAAAQACGIELVVVERPCAEEGVSLDEAKRRLEMRYGL